MCPELFASLLTAGAIGPEASDWFVPQLNWKADAAVETSAKLPVSSNEAWAQNTGTLKLSAQVAAADVTNVARNIVRATNAETAVEQAAFS